VKDCNYIGTILTNKNKLRLETEKRITNANGVYFALFPLLNRQSVLRAEKVKICKTVIGPLATYRVESQIMNKDIAQLLKEEF